MDKTYTLEQLFTNPRDNTTFATVFGTYATLAEAKKNAKDMRGRWIIVEHKIVARSAS